MRPVTVDTGGQDDVFPGAIVTWLHRPRGGYGYVCPVEAKVVSNTRRPHARVHIEVTAKDGSKVIRTVQAKHLRWSA